MKHLGKTFVFALLVLSTGCASSRVVDLARGHTLEPVDISQLRKGDRFVDGEQGTIYVIRDPKEKDSSHPGLPTVPPDYYHFFFARPCPAYYALLVLSVPTDVATFAIQAFALGTAGAGH